ncbi:MAG: YafY family protein [Pseudomonadota bacterium]
MRRAERLFEIIQLLRRHGLMRARELAERLEVSERTVYRDIQAMMAQGVPIEGEAGLGYVLRQGYDLPPLMFDEAEIEALMLGARIVESLGDAELSDAAGSAVAKIEAVLPDALRAYMCNTALLAPPMRIQAPIGFDVSHLRRALREHRKVAFSYTDGTGSGSERVVRPLSLAYFGPIWLLAAWCELREDFRVFRLDRIVSFSVRDETFKPEPGRSLEQFLARDETWNRGKGPRPDPSEVIDGRAIPRDQIS